MNVIARFNKLDKFDFNKIDWRKLCDIIGLDILKFILEDSLCYNFDYEPRLNLVIREIHDEFSFLRQLINLHYHYEDKTNSVLVPYTSKRMEYKRLFICKKCHNFRFVYMDVVAGVFKECKRVGRSYCICDDICFSLKLIE